VALFKALTSGQSGFVALAVVARLPGGPAPCGACRQLLAEYAPKARLFLADSARPGRIREFAVLELLPYAFTLLRGRGRRAAKRTAFPRAGRML
jgi:cytidine deaminase